MMKGCKGLHGAIIALAFFLPMLMDGQVMKSVPTRLEYRKALSQEELQALNACINYINEVVYQTRWLQQGLVAYNLHANYFHGVDLSVNEPNSSLSFSVPNFNLPDSSARIAKSKILAFPTEYQTEIYSQIDSIDDIFLEMAMLYKQLSDYVKIKQYQRDNLKASNAILSKYEELFQVLNHKCSTFNILLTKIYSTHPHENPEDQWDKLYGSLKNVVDKNYGLYQGIQYQFRFRKDSSFVQLTVDALRHENWLRQYSLAESIIATAKTPKQKIIEELYDGMMDQSLIMAVKTQQLQPSYFEDHLTYERLTYNYNQTVLLFNKFVELAPRPFLKKTLQVFLYRHLRLPESTQEEEEPLITETPLDWVSMEDYAPNHLILLLDVSRSMNSEEKLPLLKRSLRHLIPVMREEDSLSIIVFSKESKLVLESTSLIDQRAIIDAITSLEPSGSTNFYKGLQLAYQIAEQHFIEEGNNRILLATDGLFDMDKKNYKLAKTYEKKGIRLSIFNFNTPKKSIDKRLFKLARKGNGNYEWINSENSDSMLLKEVQAQKKEPSDSNMDTDD